MSKEADYSYAPNGIAYQFDEGTGKWHPYDPEKGERVAGRPRKTLPSAGIHGVTARGAPKTKSYPPNRSAASNKTAVYRKTARRKRKRHVEIEGKIKEAEGELKEVEKKLSAAEQLKLLVANAPTVKEQRAAILGLFAEYEFSPVAELIKMIMEDEVSGREKIAILKTLAEFEAPKPKSIDIEGEVKGSMTISVVDFLGTSQKALKDVTPETVELTDADYEQFETEVS